MDIVVFGLLMSIALIVIALDFYRPTMYLAVFGGIIIVLMGIFMSVDGGFTQSFCVTDTVGGIICQDHSLPVPSFWADLIIGVGGIMMFLGAGVITDSAIRWHEQKRF